MEIYFSPAALAFYDGQLKDVYVQSGTWPKDATKISDDKYKFLLEGQSNGKIISLDGQSAPILVSPPPLTQDECIIKAENQKHELMDVANKFIAPLQDAVDFGEATDEEAALLVAWKKYRILLSRIDPNNVPDIKWPTAPL